MSFLGRLCWLHVESSLHVGVGQGVGFIDLPIMREKTTNWPIVPGSSIKGVIRAYHEDDKTKSQLLNRAFGQPDDKGSLAGSLVFADAHIVLMPVRSLYGTFAYVTSPLVLSRLKRNMISVHLTGAKELPDVHAEESSGLQCCDNSKLHHKEVAFFEEYDYQVQTTQVAVAWGKALACSLFPESDTWQRLFKERFAIIRDNDFDFLCKSATEVNARIRIDSQKGSVESGALWYEESLPVETVLAGLVWCDKVYEDRTSQVVKVTASDLLNTFCRDALRLQMGGKASVGKGCVRAIFTEEVK